MDIVKLALGEIDPEAIAIANLRTVNEESEHFTALLKQIELVDQKEPILVRKLRDGEKKKEGAVYGVLDGHHRYAVFVALQKERIQAIIVESENEISDLMQAAGANLSHESLELWQKGQILVTLKEKQNRKLKDVAADFGIARSTAFKYQAAYQRHKKNEEGKKSIKEKPLYDSDKLEKMLSDFKLNAECADEESFKEEIRRVDELTSQLSSYKRQLRDRLRQIKSSK